MVKKSRQDGFGNTITAAISKSGALYIGGKIESDTNLLDITSEQSAIVKAVQNKDYAIRHIVTLSELKKPIVSPIVLKMLVDFGRRTGKKIAYTVVTKNGKIIWETKNVEKALPFYSSPQVKLTLKPTKNGVAQKNWGRINTHDKIAVTLKNYALKGLKLAFTTYDGASCYGVSVVTGDGKIYYGGQYSAPDKRNGLHAEMAVLTGVLMDGNRDITHIAIVSDKFIDKPCAVCGPCRQFMNELSNRFDWKLHIYSFAKEKNIYTISTIEKLLPDSWQSKKW